MVVVVAVGVWGVGSAWVVRSKCMKLNPAHVAFTRDSSRYCSVFSISSVPGVFAELRISIALLASCLVATGCDDTQQAGHMPPLLARDLRAERSGLNNRKRYENLV